MAEFNVYVANLGKYTEGELVGAWFTPPIDFDEMKERIGLNGRYEEYAIHDYEAPFSIDEYTSIEEINSLAEIADTLPDYLFENAQQIIEAFGFEGLEDLAAKQDEIVMWPCDSIEDVAAMLVEEGAFGEIPEGLANYIDYAAIARDMEINDYWVNTRAGLLEYTGR